MPLTSIQTCNESVDHFPIYSTGGSLLSLSVNYQMVAFVTEPKIWLIICYRLSIVQYNSSWEGYTMEGVKTGLKMKKESITNNHAGNLRVRDEQVCGTWGSSNILTKDRKYIHNLEQCIGDSVCAYLICIKGYWSTINKPTMPTIKSEVFIEKNQITKKYGA